jgi:oligosaccharyl transferase (archaeosortase A-associated)
MNINRLSQYRSYFIFILIIFFIIFSLWLRGLSEYSIDLPRYLTYQSPDIWYNFRQVELMVHNFPDYAWYDPMTAYPFGKTIDWGPLMPFIGSGLSLMFGMTSRFEIMYIASCIPPLFAALTIPVVYLLGERIWNYKIGLVASGLITILSSVYLVDTSFGYFDHHCVETFFSTTFCLMYITTLLYSKNYHSMFKNPQKLIIFLILAVISAVFYFLSYLNMPTIILFGLIVAVFTFFQTILEVYKNNSIIYLFYTNLSIFSLILVMMAAFGVKQAGISLHQYSIGQILAIFFIIIETVVLFWLSRYFKNNKKLFSISVIFFTVAFFITLTLFSNGSFIIQLVSFFGQSGETSAISELGGWNLERAFNSLYFSIVLSFLGFIALLYQTYQNLRDEYIFFIIWTFTVLIATIGHSRYEYYFVVNVALLSALGIISGIELGLYHLNINRENLPSFFTRRKEEKLLSHKSRDKGKQKTNREKNKKSKRSEIIGFIVFTAIIIMTGYTITASIEKDIMCANSLSLQIDSKWVETMEWVSLHTQDPGVQYLSIYKKDDFEYPKESYGFMAWWDYGHYITFIGKRIPITNPFQDNLRGPNGAASFFLTDTEENATKILERLGGRYVITDTSTATEVFPSVTKWNDPKGDVLHYMRSFFREGTEESVQLNIVFQPYFQTTLVRLHNFDGSMKNPEKIILMEYYIENREGLEYPLIVNAWLLTPDEAAHALEQYIPRSETDVLQGGQYLSPLEKIPAMRHFRLVYESPGNSTNLKIHDISGIESIPTIKIFEKVPGARIKGNGTLEIQIITNTGRSFIYQQESIDGEFIVPYSTIGNPYEVKTAGKYRIIENNQEFEVIEDDIVSGGIIILDE